jgi:hypothetical protein
MTRKFNRPAFRQAQHQHVSTSKPITKPAADRRSAEAELRTLIEKFAPPPAAARVRRIASLRRSLRKRLPTAHEVVYEYRDCFVISYSPSEHGYEGVLSIRASADGVRLYFNRGKGLPDPEKLLRGSANARWIEVDAASTLTRPGVASLIDEALARNPVPFAPAGRGLVIVRPTAAKQRAAKPRVRRRPA